MKLKDTEIINIDLNKEFSCDYDLNGNDKTIIEVEFKDDPVKYRFVFNEFMYSLKTLDIFIFLNSYDNENKTKEDFLSDLGEQFEKWILIKYHDIKHSQIKKRVQERHYSKDFIFI